MGREKIVKNALWRLMERCGAQGITLVVSIVLARLLSPTDYGTVSLVLVFLTIMEVFVDSGLGNALIQKKDADELDFSSVFIFNMIFCCFLYVIMFFAAPLIAKFYDNSSLTSLVRVLSITLIISGFKNIQIAYVSRHLMFKKFFFATLVGTISAAIVGISLAYMGLGVWVLVAQNLVNQVIDTIVLWITVEWRPKKQFSWGRFKALYSFAWKLLATNLIDTIYQKIRQLVIGKVYTSSDLAYYNQGQTLPYAIVSNVNVAMDSVLFPALSKEQDDKENLKQLTQKAMTMSLYIMAPLLMGMAAVADSLVRVLLTEKWLPCVFYIRITCISFLFYPINTANINAIKALGRSDIVLKLEIAKKALGIFLLLITFKLGVRAIAIGTLVASAVAQILNCSPNKKLLGYRYMEQIKDIFPTLFLSVIMYIVVISIPTFISAKPLFQLICQIIVGGLIYWIVSMIFKLKEYATIIVLIKAMLGKRVKKEK